MNAPLTQTGTLPFGVLVQGVRHRSFELRLPTVEDNIQALDEVSQANPVLFSAAVFARQLLSLGSLTPPPAIKPELKAGDIVPTYISTDLIRGLDIVDYNELERATNELQKKMLALVAEETSGKEAPGTPGSNRPWPELDSLPGTADSSIPTN